MNEIFLDNLVRFFSFLVFPTINYDCGKDGKLLWFVYGPDYSEMK